MGLSDSLISQFVKVTKDEKETKKETTVYGTIVDDNGTKKVQIDGSDQKTPVSKAATAEAGDRVTVLIKNHKATVTGNLTSPSVGTGYVDKFETLIADKVSTKEFYAETAKIDTLIADNATIRGELEASKITVADLEADNVEINEKLDANTADINTLKASKLDASVADITYAKIDDLTAATADIRTLMFGSAGGNTIQTSFSNTVIGQLGDAQIKSAMIESVSADKITAGDIITNNVRVMSEDGKLLISDETLQISDNNRVRVQVGKDAAGDYSINVWDQNGNLMFSKGGITDAAIKEAIIRNDMVSDTANISASKLDIDSLFSEINGSTNTIKSSQVYLDSEKQTLDIAFKSLLSEVLDNGAIVSSQGTSIEVLQGYIATKIWQQDIDTAKNELSTQYSTLEQTVDSISTTVASHTTEISNKADSSTVSTINNKVTTLEQSLDGFKTTVSETYATKEVTDVIETDITDLYSTTSSLEIRVASNESSITQLSDRITTNVTEISNLGTRATTLEQTASGLSVKIDEIEIGGRNFIPGSRHLNGTGSTNYNGKLVLDSGFTAFKCTGNWHGVKRNANDLILDSKDGDTFTFSLNIKTSDVCSLSFYAMCYTSDKQRVYPEYTTGQFNDKRIITTNSEEEKDQRVYIAFQVTQGWIDLINDGGTIDWTLQVHDGASSTNPAYLYAPKLERGNKPTDWTPAPEDAEGGILDAAKTATNYLNLSTNGLVIGDLTADTLGKNILIDSDSVDIRSGTNVRASFGEDYLYLAKHSRNAKIDLCNGLVELYHQSKYSYDTMFVIDTPNATEIKGTYNPLYVTSTVTGKVAIQFSNTSGTLGSIGMVESASGAMITRNIPSTASTYTVLDTGNYYTMMDSGWLYGGSIGDGFSIYANDTQIQYRKIGKTVHIRGAVKPTKDIAGSTTSYELFTLPTGYRPSVPVYARCQGSSANTWLLSITAAGVVRFSRYGYGTTYVTATAGTWLPFNVTFFVD